ncbi:hypothetical protein KEM56_007562 [Ascosphaera pollenicola]|nr:hypothetical protein KEM56_007562 [Ascosphaera pollenicola]
MDRSHSDNSSRSPHDRDQPMPPAFNANTNANLYPMHSYAPINASQFLFMPGQDHSGLAVSSMQAQAGGTPDHQAQLLQPFAPEPMDHFNHNPLPPLPPLPPSIGLELPKMDTSAASFEDYSNFASNDAKSPIASSPYNPSSPNPLSINPADLSRQPSPNSSASPRPPSVRYSNADPLSPASSPAPFYTPQHSRHTSLDPATAAYMANQHNPDWHGLLSEPHFRSHRSHTRAPSEVSDVSSVAHSPFPQNDTSDYDNNHSPLLGATDSSFAENTLGMESFTISDFQRSPYISPNLMPQQPSIDLGADANFMLGNNNNQSLQANDPFLSDQSLNTLNAFSPSHMSGDMGQAAQLTTPSINVEFAPPSRQASFGPKPEMSGDNLSLPMARRGRSKSDPFGNTGTRSVSESAIPSNTLGQNLTIGSTQLSPSRAGNLSTPGSRDASPVSRSRRQSTSSIENRNYILDLADPQRPGGNISDNKRIQKHPASFQCSLCPKKFTRAYNLRSHLRTHTDERPFVCTVCGKAFARQHDRKRHEGLHSGEKKFVCQGALKNGRKWGCGRRFARADALGRHFRSEAGRICIKPLLDEEAHEHNRGMMQQSSGAGTQDTSSGNYQPMSQPMIGSSLDVGSRPTSGSIFPAAIIAQYPDLQGINWNQMAAAARQDDCTNDLRHTSYDASSAGELSFTEDDGYLSSSSQIHTPSFSPVPPNAAANNSQQALGVPRPTSALSADAAWPSMDMSWNNYGTGR